MIIRFAQVAVEELLHLSTYRLQLTAELISGETADEKIFLMCRRSAFGEQTALDTFADVCAPDDMDRYPVDDPNEDTEFPFYRTATVELDFTSLDLLEDAKELIIARAKILRRSLEALATLHVAGTEDIG